MAMQAAAMALGLLRSANQKRSQMRELEMQSQVGQRMIALGAQIEQGELSLRMQEEAIASKEQGMFNMERLRETLASQNALASARGVERGSGTAGAMTNTAVNNFNTDERAREMNLLSTQRGLSTQKDLSKLNQTAASFQLNTQIRTQRQSAKDAFVEKFLNTAGGTFNSLTASQGPAPVETRTATQGNTTDYGRAYTARTGRR